MMMMMMMMTLSTHRVFELAEYFGLRCAVVEKDGQLLQPSSVIGNVVRSRCDVATDVLELDVTFW